MDCRTCKNLIWEYHDGDLDSDSAREVDEHLEGCAACRQDLAAQKDISRYLKEHMPVYNVDNFFVQVTMNKIALLEESGSFLKPVFGISILLAGIVFAVLIAVSPIFTSLLWLIGSIIFTLTKQGALIIKIAPLMQLIIEVVLSTLLIIVLAYMRRLAMRRVA